MRGIQWLAAPGPRAALLTAAVLLNLSLCSLCALPRRGRESPTPTPPPAGAGLDAIYADPEGFWSVRYPSGWQQVVRGSETQFRADGSGQTGVAVSIQVKAVSPAGLAGQVSTLLSTRLADYAVAAQRETTVDGYPAVEVTHTYTQGGDPIEGFLLALVRGRVGFVALGYAPAPHTTALHATLHAIAHSLDVAEFDAAPPYEAWPVHSGQGLTFRYLPESYAAGAIGEIAAAHERVLVENAARLGMDPGGGIDFYLYPSAEALYRATARRYGFAIVEQREVHALWAGENDHQSLGHEMTHVLAYGAWGEAGGALLGEGLAVCLDHAAPHPHDRAAQWAAQGRLYPLSDMLGEAWFDLDPEVAYPQSGSVACWLLDAYGVDSVRRLYGRPDLEAALVDVCGIDLAAVERAWRERVAAR